MEKLPKIIEPCPILEATFELRFDTNIVPDAVFGIVYEKFKSDYKNYEKLPIININQETIKKNPELKYLPRYRLSNDLFIIQLGANILSVTNKNDYKKWDIYKEELLKIIKNITETKIVSKYTRFGIRYIDFFEGNIFNNINLKLEISGANKEENPKLIRVLENYDRFSMVLQIGSSVIVKRDNIEYNGSTIDIDTSINNLPEDFISNTETYLEEGHNIQKKYFFDLINKDFLDTNYKVTY